MAFALTVIGICSFLNFLATKKMLARSQQFTRTQLRVQLLIVWCIPLFGAIVIFAFFARPDSELKDGGPPLKGGIGYWTGLR